MLRKNYRPIISITVMYGSFFALIFLQKIVSIVSYPYLIFADAYTYLAISTAIAKTGSIPTTRPYAFPEFGDTIEKIVPLLGSILSLVPKIDVHIFYRFFLPLLLTLLFLLLVIAMLRRIFPKKSTLLFLVIPLGLAAFFNPSPYALETLFLQGIPQTFALLLFTVELFIILRYLTHTNGGKRWLALMVFIYFSWSLIHQSHFLFLPMLSLAIFLKERSRLMSMRAIPLALAIIVIVAIFFSRNFFWLLESIQQLTFRQDISFDYIHNTIGSAVLIMGIFGLMLIIGRGKYREKHLLYGFFTFTLLASIALILFIKPLPDFGFFHLVYTYRLFPHLIILLLPIAAWALSFLTCRIPKVHVLVVGALMVILPTMLIQPHRQGGWILGAEPEVIPILEQATPENSIVFTQPLNAPLLMTAKRTMFVSGSIAEQKDAPTTRNNQEIFFASSSADAYRTIMNSFQATHPIYTFGSYRKPAPADQIRPKYVLYSKLKPIVNNDFGDWWVLSSYPQAKIENFRDTRYFSTVFENKDIVLWKVTENAR